MIKVWSTDGRQGQVTLNFLFPPSINAPANRNFHSPMSFSKVYGSLLLPFIENYKEAENQKGRSAVVKNAVDAVSNAKDLLEEQGGNLPKDLRTVCVSFLMILFVFLSMLMMLGHQSIY